MADPLRHEQAGYSRTGEPYPPPPKHSSIDPRASLSLSPPTGKSVRPSLQARNSSSSSSNTQPPTTSEPTGDRSDSRGSPLEGKSTAAAGGPPRSKGKRQRKPASCVGCRGKKLRCNRADPCDQCSARGLECSWDGAEPLYSRRNESDAQELRDQVARLESLVRYLTSQRREEEVAQGSSSRGNSPSSPVVVSFPSKTAGHQPASSPTLSAGQKTSYAMDLRANDLCEGLAQLAVKEFVVVEGSGNDSWAPGNQRGLEFIDEARLFLRTMPQQFGVATHPAFSVPPSSNGSLPSRSRVPSDAQMSGETTPASPIGSVRSSSSRASFVGASPISTSSFNKEAPPLSEALKFMPTRAQAHSAYTYFVGYVDWYAHPVHLATFEKQWKELDAALQLPDEDARIRAIDPFFLATALGVWATGLSMMPLKRALRDGFPEDKDRIVDQWLEGAMNALTCGRFLENPSFESVRACIVLSTFFVFTATGERCGAGMGLLSLVVQIAASLGLHRDPDRSPGKFTFFEAEERRRLFWNLFMLCILSSASLSRTWAVFDLNNVDTRLPLDCHDHEILDEGLAKAGIEKRQTKFEETAMTSLIVKMKLAVLARKMNDRAFGIHPVPYEEILAIDAELREFEEAIPSRYRIRLDPSGALIRPAAHVTVTEMRACMIMISLAGEYLRLHRPWLLLSAQNKAFQYSRDQAIKYSKLLLAIYRSPSCSKSKWGGLTYKATNAAIVLAVDMLAFPEQAEVDSLRTIVRAVQKQMESQAAGSTLCRKGSRLLSFLLEKEAALTAARDQRRSQKRTRVDTGASTRGSRSLRAVFDSRLVGQTPFVHERDDDTLLHKADFGFTYDEPYAYPPPPSQPAPRHIAAAPSRTQHAPPPLPPDHVPPSQAPRSLPGRQSPTYTMDGATFAEFAGTFDFDFRVPESHPSFPSPAPTHDSSSYAHSASLSTSVEYLPCPPQYISPGLPQYALEPLPRPTTTQQSPQVAERPSISPGALDKQPAYYDPASCVQQPYYG
ncbi:hypothetical protein JCM10212_006548 [Sporobolomyces blumeae]